MTTTSGRGAGVSYFDWWEDDLSQSGYRRCPCSFSDVPIDACSVGVSGTWGIASRYATQPRSGLEA